MTTQLAGKHGRVFVGGEELAFSDWTVLPGETTYNVIWFDHTYRFSCWSINMPKAMAAWRRKLKKRWR